MGRVALASVAGLVTVQDLGRPGRLHEGIPRGGALFPELLARANRAVGNPPNTAALEIFGRASVRALEGEALFSLDGEGPVPCAADAELAVTASPLLRVRYLAVRGGFDVPEVLGGRGTLLVAALGGHQGRPLRRGDVLPLGAPKAFEPGVQPPLDLDLQAPVRVRPGPDLASFAEGALETLFNSTWQLMPESDRTGTRLAGPLLARSGGDAALSAPMVPGAIQVPRAGAPIVLGPDHPTTGGYPLLGVVLQQDLGRFAARRVGQPVRFAAG